MLIKPRGFWLPPLLRMTGSYGAFGMGCGDGCSNVCAVDTDCCSTFPAQLDVTLPNDWSLTGINPCSYCPSIGGKTYTLSNFTTLSPMSATLVLPNNQVTYLYQSSSTVCTVFGSGWYLGIFAQFKCTGSPNCRLNVRVTLLAAGVGNVISSTVYQLDPTADTHCFSSPWSVPYSTGLPGSCAFSSSGPITVSHH